MYVLSSFCDDPNHQDVNEAASCQALLPDPGAVQLLGSIFCGIG